MPISLRCMLYREAADGSRCMKFSLTDTAWDIRAAVKLCLSHYRGFTPSLRIAINSPLPRARPRKTACHTRLFRTWNMLTSGLPVSRGIHDPALEVHLHACCLFEYALYWRTSVNLVFTFTSSSDGKFTYIKKEKGGGHRPTLLPDMEERTTSYSMDRHSACRSTLIDPKPVKAVGKILIMWMGDYFPIGSDRAYNLWS